MRNYYEPKELIETVVDVLIDLIQEDTTTPTDKLQGCRLLHEIVQKSGSLLAPVTPEKSEGEDQAEEVEGSRPTLRVS